MLNIRAQLVVKQVMQENGYSAGTDLCGSGNKYHVCTVCTARIWAQAPRLLCAISQLQRGIDLLDGQTTMTETLCGSPLRFRGKHGVAASAYGHLEGDISGLCRTAVLPS